MAKASPTFSNFTAGELSPKLDGRTELSKYFNGAKQLQNFLVVPQGGATRRPGTQFIAETKTSANAARLIPFEFNVTQAYVLEFGNNYFRIFKDGGQVVDGSSNPIEVTTTYTSAQLPGLKFAQSADVMFIVHPDHKPRQITRTDHDAWTITDVAFRRGPMLDPQLDGTTLTANGRTGTGVTITASANTFASTDVGRLVKLHDGFAEITAFTSATSVTATVKENEDRRSELMPSMTATTISFHEGDPSGTGLEHNDRLQDSAGGFLSEGFKVGMKVTITGSTSNNKTSALIVTVTADTILFAPSVDLVDEAAGDTVTINGDLVADDEFSLGAFSTTTGFPAAVAFFEQRLVFANTTANPQTMFFSVGGDFTDFAIGTRDDSALVYTIGSNQVNVIRYLTSSRQLLVGTSGGEFVVRAGSVDAPISPTNTQIKRQASYGSADIQPITVANVALFVQRAGRKLRELTYNFDTDSYIAPDMTLLAEHITEGLIKEMAFQQEPDNVVWCILKNGKFVGMTYRREEDVVAWHEHIFGGVSGACTITVTDFANIAVGTTLTFTKSDGNTVTFTSEASSGESPSSSLGFRPNESNNTTADNIFTAVNAHADFTVANPAANVVTIEETQRAGSGFLSVVSTDTTRLATTDQSFALAESVAVIPSETTEDEVYVLVNRTINGSTKRYVERMKPIEFGTDIENAFFVDSGLTYSGSAATTISGLNHLEGENVRIIANGSTHPDKLVSSGAITLDRSTTKAHIGLSYESTLQTMRVEAGGTEGTSQGKTKRIRDLTLRVLNSVGAKVGPDENNLELIPFRDSSMSMNEAVPLFTGDKDIEFPSGYDSDGFIVVKQDQALPLTILSIFPRLQTFDR